MAFTVRMKGKGISSVSVKGETIEADDDGLFEVPTESVEELKQHGLEVVAEGKKPADKGPKK